MQLADLPDLRRLIEQSRAMFVLRLCDPYWEHNKEHWWYKFVGEMLDHPRVHVMLTYQPAEITALFASRARRSRFVYAPYVYRPEKERPIHHEDRRHALIFSGAVSSTLYPLRSRILAVARLYPPLFLMTERLPHPGYPDISGNEVTHKIVGEKYIDYLTRFRFGVVCSSRCRLEFLKYREFAYAGIVPVGDMPATLLDCPPDAWIAWRRNVVALTRTIKNIMDSQERAEKYRSFLRARRHVDSMRAWVNEQLSRL